MAVTVRGTDILFNDGTTQSTAAGAVNTTSVLNATAGASLGAVGSYAEMLYVGASPQNITAGVTTAGSNLRYSNSIRQSSGPTPSGTWRCMGTGYQVSTDSYGGSTFIGGVTLWLRIS